jgi:hypothetical protein
MNLTELRARLRRRIGNPDTVSVSETNLTEAINEAYQHILDRYPHSSGRSWFRFDTVIGTSRYTLPGHIGAVRYVYDIDRRKALRQVQDGVMATFDDRPNSRPNKWMRDGHSIILFGAPDAVYAIGVRGKVVSAPLQDPLDEPIVDQTWHEGIVKRARYEWWDSVGDFNKARTALLSWEEWISSKPALVQEELATTQQRVLVEPGRPLYGPRYSSRFFDNGWGFEDYGE